LTERARKSFARGHIVEIFIAARDDIFRALAALELSHRGMIIKKISFY